MSCGEAEWMGKGLPLRTSKKKKGFSEKLLKRSRLCISIPTGTTGFSLFIACLTLTILMISLEYTNILSNSGSN